VFVFGRGKFWGGRDCRVAGAATVADAAPDCPLGADVALVAGLGLRSNPLPDLWATANKGAIARRRAAVFAILIQKAFLKRTRISTVALCRFDVRLSIEKTLNFPIQPFFPTAIQWWLAVKRLLINRSVAVYGRR
jgi:hypothetical protein